MALASGTNCGFVSSAPSSDPGGSTTGPISGYQVGFKSTCPGSGTQTVSEIGWWQGSTTNNHAHYGVGIYTDNGSLTAPGSVVGSISTGEITANTAEWNKVTGLSISVTGGTVYWITVGADGTGNTIDVTDNASFLYVWDFGVTTPYLESPWNGSVDNDYNRIIALYAVYAAAGGATVVPQIMAGQRFRRI